MHYLRQHFLQTLTLLFLISSVIAGVFLLRQEQDLRNFAQYEGCECAAACPTNGGCYRVRCNGVETDINGGATNCPAQGVTCPPGKTYNSSLKTCDDGNTGSGQVTPAPDPSSTYNPSSPVANPDAATWSCKVCDCSQGGWVNGQCTKCGLPVPCSSVKSVTCGQIDACPPGQPESQCGASSQNYVINNNCAGTSTGATSIPNTPIPTKIIAPTPTPTGIPNTPIPTRIPTPTSVPTSTPIPTATPIPTSTPMPTATPTSMPTSTPIPTYAPETTYLSCGQAGCNQANMACKDGLSCVQTTSGVYRCATDEAKDYCSSHNSSSYCCKLPPTPKTTYLTCGQIGCDQAYKACSDGLICIKTESESSRCGVSELQQSCASHNSSEYCCSTTPTPTHILLPKTGFDLPLRGVTITGGILTLLGVLLIL